MSKQLSILVAILLAASLACVFAFYIPSSRELNASLFDRFVREADFSEFTFGKKQTKLPEAALLFVDEAALSSYPYITPVPRDLLAKLVRFLDKAGARLIVIDIFLKGLSFPEKDQELKTAIEAADNVLLVSTIRDFQLAKNQDGDNEILNPDTAIRDLPDQLFQSAAKGVALAMAPVEPIDETVRFYYNKIQFNDQTLYPLASAAVQSLGGTVPEENLFRILYSGPPSNTPDIQKQNWAYHSGLDKLSWEIPNYLGFQIDQGFYGRELLDAFRDKVVFVGVNVNDIKKDFFRTPFYHGQTAFSETAGIEIHAQAYETIRNGRITRSMPVFAEFCLALLFASLFVLLSFFVPLYVAISGAAFASLLHLLFLPTLFFPNGLEYPILATSLATILGSISGIIIRTLTEGKQKRFIKNAFQKFIAPEYVEQLMKNPNLLELGGEEKEITVLFSDLAGFTTLSEKKAPKELVTFLNEYLDGMTKIVQKHGGTLDKFIGDAIMAFWNAPLPQDNYAGKAVAAAIEMQAFSRQLSERLEKEDFGAIVTRIGLNTGSAIVGNMGASTQFNYTTIGDEINLGARLEGANKQYGSLIMISESTYAAINPADFPIRELDQIRVKGKSKPVRVFEIMVEKIYSSDYLSTYRNALNLYYQQKFTEAEAQFSKLSSQEPNDLVPGIYIERCTSYRKNPPADWDGSFTLTSK